MSNPAFNSYPIKSMDPPGRYPLRVPDSTRPRPRQSEPPMMTNPSAFDLDTSHNNPKNTMGYSPNTNFNKFLKNYQDTLGSGKTDRFMQMSPGYSQGPHYQLNKSSSSANNYQQFSPSMGTLPQNFGNSVPGSQEWGSPGLNPKLSPNNYLNGKNMPMRQPDASGFTRNNPNLNSQKLIRNEGAYEPIGSSRYDSQPNLLNYYNPSHSNVSHHAFDYNSKPAYNDVHSNRNAPTTQKRMPRFSEPAMLFSDDISQSTSSGSQYPSPVSTSYKNIPNGGTPPPPIRTRDGQDGSNLPGSMTDMFKKNKDGSAFSPSKLRQSGFRKVDFALGKELGKGKFGTVQIVKHIKTGFVCAMKTVPKSVIRDQNIVGQFSRQLKIQSCLEHPNIIKMYGFFDDKENVYLLLEIGSEGQLYKLLKDKKRLTEATTAYIMRQICEAIKYLHSLNIIHRDIKPENIVVNYGTVKLCDFGWAVCKGSELRSTFCGTPLYVSPEILKGQLYDEKIDLWSIGILTYELMVGDIPFDISSEEELIKIIKQDIVFPKDVDISDEAKDFVLKILKKNPDDRLKVEKLLDHPFLNKPMDAADIDL